MQFDATAQASNQLAWYQVLKMCRYGLCAVAARSATVRLEDWLGSQHPRPLASKPIPISCWNAGLTHKLPCRHVSRHFCIWILRLGNVWKQTLKAYISSSDYKQPESWMWWQSDTDKLAHRANEQAAVQCHTCNQAFLLLDTMQLCKGRHKQLTCLLWLVRQPC